MVTEAVWILTVTIRILTVTVVLLAMAGRRLHLEGGVSDAHFCELVFESVLSLLHMVEAVDDDMSGQGVACRTHGPDVYMVKALHVRRFSDGLVYLAEADALRCAVE